jgi:hypothetical protein
MLSGVYEGARDVLLIIARIINSSDENLSSLLLFSCYVDFMQIYWFLLIGPFLFNFVFVKTVIKYRGCTRSALFWDITQRQMVTLYRNVGKRLPYDAA